MKMCVNLICQGNAEMKFFSQETYDFQILENEALIIAGYENIKFSTFHWLAAKLWRQEDDDLHTSNP